MFLQLMQRASNEVWSIISLYFAFVIKDQGYTGQYISALKVIKVEGEKNT